MWVRWHQWMELHRKLDIIERLLRRSLRMEMSNMAVLDDLTAAVAAQKSVDDSIEALLDGIAQQLKDAQATNDPAAIQAIIADLQNNTAKVQAAITKNTPVTPTETAATT